jgi:cobalt/nickel transport system permease protein
LSLSALLAVHIADTVLTRPWEAAGFAGAAALAALGAWRVRDEEIPRIALLTAAFFVASQVHIRVGPTSVHLLLNGLVGVVLGRRAGLAVLVGLTLQAILFQHGGYYALGINCCVMAVPALAAGGLFTLLHRAGWVRRPGFRTAVVAGSTLVWALSLVYGVALVWTNARGQLSALDTSAADRLTLHPATLAAALLFSLAAAAVERRWGNFPEFPLGLLIGEGAVLLTVLLNALVLVWGSREDWPALVLSTVVPHVLLGVIEGVVLGFTVGFLARVKPEMLGVVDQPDDAAPTGPQPPLQP